MIPEIISQSARPDGVVLCRLNPKETMMKGRNVHHQCGACHRASDAQVRIARIILEYRITCRLGVFHTFVGVRSEVLVYILASFS